jgi:hypothetical protein
MALTDIRESLNELIFYRKEYFVPSGLTTPTEPLTQQKSP